MLRSSTKGADVKLFDISEQEVIKESFVHNKETTDPLDSPKFYVNVVYADKVLPPLDKNREFANPNDDSTWLILPVVFT